MASGSSTSCAGPLAGAPARGAAADRTSASSTGANPNPTALSRVTADPFTVASAFRRKIQLRRKIRLRRNFLLEQLIDRQVAVIHYRYGPVRGADDRRLDVDAERLVD